MGVAPLYIAGRPRTAWRRAFRKDSVVTVPGESWTYLEKVLTAPLFLAISFRSLLGVANLKPQRRRLTSSVSSSRARAAASPSRHQSVTLPTAAGTARPSACNLSKTYFVCVLEAPKAFLAPCTVTHPSDSRSLRSSSVRERTVLVTPLGMCTEMPGF